MRLRILDGGLRYRRQGLLHDPARALLGRDRGKGLRLIPAASAVRQPGVGRATAPTIAARNLNEGVAVLALSVLVDSAIEHYRGSFQNRAMYAPLIASTLTLAASLSALREDRPQPKLWREAIYATAAAVGVAGFGFHIYNIWKRPGGFSWLNLFYAAPIGAPGALILAGLIGRGAERAGGSRARSFRPFQLPLGRMLALASAAGLAGAVGEAGLLHFRGAFHNPAMILPLSAPPVASALLGASAVKRQGPRRLARWSLKLTAVLGAIGSGFHIYGVSRNMGGWRNWRQNVLNGPPLPAPPSFSGLALAGLAALRLIDNETHG